MWSLRMPGEYEFGQLPAVFGSSNYVQIMMAMGLHPPTESLRARFHNGAEAAAKSSELRKVADSGLAVLPDHRQLLEAIGRAA